MSATLASDNLFPQVSALPKAVSMVSPADAVTQKPSFFVRILEAIGRTYYVPTSDGKGFYMLPPV